MLTLVFGRDWTVNRDVILEKIAADVKNEKTGRILLVPELISHDMERRLAAVAGDTSSRYAQVLSFSRLARRVCEIVGSGAQECLDNGGRVVAMASAARQLVGQLKAYASVETKPEFLTSLVDAVDEFKRCCISAEDLMEAAAQTQGAFAQKLTELALLLQAYDGLCQHGKRDPRDQMSWVLEQLEDMDFAKEHVFYVDGFPDFTRQHMAVLELLLRRAPDVTVSLNCDGPDTQALAFEKAAQTARELLQCAARAGVPVHMEFVEERAHPLRNVRDGLFQGSTAYVPELEGKLTLWRSESVYQECQAVAEQILQMVADGCRYRDMALVCADLPGYRRVLQLVFRKCGIPLYLSGTEDILDSGVISTVLLALDAAMGGFEQKAMLRYLRSAMSPLSQDLCDLVENHVIIWGISGKGWTEPWTQHPEGLAGVWEEVSHARIAQLEEARKQVMGPMMALRHGFREAKDLRTQVLALYGFLEQIDFAQRLDAYSQYMLEKGDPRGAQILNQLWEILLSALEQLHDVLGHTGWDSENFARLLRLLLSQYDVGTIPPVLDAVMAGPVSAMRCQQTKHLFVLGAKEGNLPGYAGSVGVLTDQERTALRDLGVPLTGGAIEGLQAEFAEIYGVFCGAEETVTVSCSDAQPSFLYRRLADMAGGETLCKPTLGSAMVNGNAAGALLAAWDQAEDAQKLGVLDAYLSTKAKTGYALGNIQPENVAGLYGKRLQLSASQVDQHSLCRMAYFLKYGLRAKERKEATVDPAEFGTYVHAVLEATARDVMAAGGFHQVDLETTLSIAKKHSDDYTQAHFSQLSSGRMEYLFHRNMEELEMVVQELWRELNESEYAPQAFELHFASDGDMPPISVQGKSMSAVLRGFVDRVDLWRRGESSYYRVVDYKTGKKDFDYCDVLNGVGLQMLLYLFALEDAGEAILGTTRVGAGIQYFPARAPFVSTDGSMTQEEAQQLRRKEWKRPGLLLEDTDSIAAMDPSPDLQLLRCGKDKNGNLTGDIASKQQLGKLKQYVMTLLENMVDSISAGDTKANPYTRGTSFNACTFCPYGDICHKECVQDRRNYKAVKAHQFWEQIEKEVADHG